MSDTPATPQPKQWTAPKRMHGTAVNVRYELSFAGQKLTIYRIVYQDAQYWRLNSCLGTGWILTATTAEEAAAEAVVAISQHLDWLREELAAIPLTLPTT